MANLKTENQFITALVEGKLTIEQILRSNFDGSWLQHRADVYDWLLIYWQTNGKLPSKDLVESRYPDFTFTEVVDNPVEIVDALRKNSELDRFVSDLSKTSTILANTQSAEAARNFLIAQLEKYDTNTDQDVFDLTSGEDSDKLLALYREKRGKVERGEKIFIPSGLGPEFDGWLGGGWKPGDLIGVLAPLGTGKSWLSMLFAGAAMKSGFSPFILALEGNVEKESYRSLTTLTHVQNSDLHTGMLPEIEFEFALRRIKEISDQTGAKYYLALHGSREIYTPTTLRQKLIKYDPDLGIVDYLSLMAITMKTQPDDWAEFSAISKSLKRIAVSLGIPLIATLQGNRASLTKESLDANDSSYFGILRDFDIVMGAQKVKGKKYVLRWNTVKGRDQEDVFDAYYRTNWNTGKTEFAGYVEEDETF